jgi:hypothetical protein
MRNIRCTARKCGVRPSPRPRVLFLFYPNSTFCIGMGVDPEDCIMYKLYIISLPSGSWKGRRGTDVLFSFTPRDEL